MSALFSRLRRGLVAASMLGLQVAAQAAPPDAAACDAQQVGAHQQGLLPVQPAMAALPASAAW